ncbi:MAG: ATP-binding domain-containing protein [Desulfobacterales bacterium]
MFTTGMWAPSPVMDEDENRLWVNFYDRTVEYAAEDMSELTLGYAISVHKSQGSEYPAVILPVITQHYVMLQRNLLYTAITRAKQLRSWWGPKGGFIAVNNNRPEMRLSGLPAGWQRVCKAERSFDGTPMETHNPLAQVDKMVSGGRCRVSESFF